MRLFPDPYLVTLYGKVKDGVKVDRAELPRRLQRTFAKDTSIQLVEVEGFQHENEASRLTKPLGLFLSGEGEALGDDEKTFFAGCRSWALDVEAETLRMDGREGALADLLIADVVDDFGNMKDPDSTVDEDEANFEEEIIRSEAAEASQIALSARLERESRLAMATRAALEIRAEMTEQALVNSENAPKMKAAMSMMMTDDHHAED